MLKHQVHFLLCIVLVLLSPAVAFADAVQGRVAGTSSSALDMTVYDSQGRPYPNALHLQIDYNTRYQGVASASMLRINDPVSAEVSQASAGMWHADSISLLQETGQVHSTASSPSPSLAGALGNPVVRNGLLGAATGAIASSASGGKAGKGALIGAGAGILGGFLADAMSQPRQPQQQGSVTDNRDNRN